MITKQIYCKHALEVAYVESLFTLMRLLHDIRNNLVYAVEQRGAKVLSDFSRDLRTFRAGHQSSEYQGIA